MSEEKKQEDSVAEESAKFKGRYVYTIGRRKTSVAQVRVYKNGKGIVIVNDKKINEYFPVDIAENSIEPLKLAGLNKDLNVSIVVRGGGTKGQADAIRHGLTRALVEMNEELKPALKAKGWFTRDARKKERKKPGLKKARRAPQWAKR